jgi:protein-tyrosine phosphatase
MLDIHCHILPDVDDGPRTLEESLALARFCVADGITDIVATPHCHRHLRLLREEIRPHVDRLQVALAEAGLPLTIWPGSEIQLFDLALYRRDYESGLYCHLGDDRAYTLLEFPWSERRYPADAAGHVNWLLKHGTIPIVAHPERHGYFDDEPDRVRALVDAGAWLQITVDSVLGNHGEGARASAEGLLETYPEAVLATDAHGLHRCSGLSQGYAWVRERFGEERAAELRIRSDRILQHLREVGAASTGGSGKESI